MPFRLLRRSDTGWRTVTGDIATPPVAGHLHVRREGPRVHIDVQGLVFDRNGSFVALGAILPQGFRPIRATEFASARRSSADTGGSIRFMSNGDGYLYQVVAGQPIYGYGILLTDQPMPTGGA